MIFGRKKRKPKKGIDQIVKKVPKIKPFGKVALAVAAAAALLYQGEKANFSSQVQKLRKQGVHEPEKWAGIRPPMVFWNGKFTLTKNQVTAMNEITELAKAIFGEKEKRGEQRILRTIKLNEREIKTKGIRSLIKRHWEAIEKNPGMWPAELEQRDNILKVFEEIMKLKPEIRREVMILAGVKFYRE